MSSGTAQLLSHTKPNQNIWLGRKLHVSIVIVTRTETCEGLLAYYGKFQLKWVITRLTIIPRVFGCTMAKIYCLEANSGRRKKPTKQISLNNEHKLHWAILRFSPIVSKTKNPGILLINKAKLSICSGKSNHAQLDTPGKHMKRKMALKLLLIASQGSSRGKLHNPGFLKTSF